jgi:RHS repeat-associated protein
MFNAKELDEESGMYYYEARYYAPPTFISRDPLFEKYPFMSPYAYCANNPVKYIDPDGRHEYEFDKKGYHVRTIENTDADILRIVKTDRKGNIKTDKDGNTKTIATSQSYKYETVIGVGQSSSSTELTIKDNESRGSMFEFLANNTKSEWATFNGIDPHSYRSSRRKSYDETIDPARQKNMIGTNRESGWTNCLHPYIDDLLDRGGTVNEYTHSHPYGTAFPRPSGYSHSSWIKPAYGEGDHAVANKYQNIPNLRVYDVGSNSYIQFWGGQNPGYKKQ